MGCRNLGGRWTKNYKVGPGEAEKQKLGRAAEKGKKDGTDVAIRAGRPVTQLVSAGKFGPKNLRATSSAREHTTKWINASGWLLKNGGAHGTRINRWSRLRRFRRCGGPYRHPAR